MIFLPRSLVWTVMAASIALAPSNFAQQSPSTSTQSEDQHGPVVKAPAGALEGQMEGELRVGRHVDPALGARTVAKPSNRIEKLRPLDEP